MLLIWATALPGQDPAELEQRLSTELERMAAVDAAEAARAVTLTETRFVRGIEQAGERADLLSMYDQLFDDPTRVNREIDRLKAVTTAEIETFASEYLGEDNRAVLTYLPEEPA